MKFQVQKAITQAQRRDFDREKCVYIIAPDTRVLALVPMRSDEDIRSGAFNRAQVIADVLNAADEAEKRDA